MEESKKDLYEVIRLNNRDYITSHNLYQHYQDRYSTLTNFNKKIRSIDEYDNLIISGSIINSEHFQDSFRNSILESLIKLNSNKPVMLIDGYAQKAIELEISKEAKSQAGKESAVLGLANIKMEYLRKEDIALFQSISMSREAQALAEQNKARIEQLEAKIEQLPTEDRVEAIAQVAGMNLIRPEDFRFKVMSIDQMKTHPWAAGMNNDQISKFLHWSEHPMDVAIKNNFEKNYHANAFTARMFLEQGLEEKFINLWKDCQYIKTGKKHHYLWHQFLHKTDSYFMINRNTNNFVENIYKNWLTVRG